MGWVGTALTLYGSYLVGEKNRTGFILQLLGNLCWAYVGFTRGVQIDLIVVSFCFATMYAFNFWKWGSPLRVRLFSYDALCTRPTKKKRISSADHSSNGRHA